MKISRDEITWGGERDDWYYVTWGWNAPLQRAFRFYRTWYDCPHAGVELWFFGISWSTPWTLPPLDCMSEAYRAKWMRRPAWLRAAFGL